MSDQLTEITTTRHFRRIRNLGITELQKFEDGYELKATDGEWYFVPFEFEDWVLEKSKHLNEAEKTGPYANDLIYGSDKTENVVSIEVKDNQVYVYTETVEGVKLEIRPFKPYFLTDTKPASNYTQLAGDLHFKYLMEFNTKAEKNEANTQLFKKYGRDGVKKHLFNLYDDREGYMIRHGLTYFKGMSPSDVSILSFDIETNKTLDPTLPHSKTLLISNTFRKNGEITRKLFALDEYKNELSMILAWCEYVREMDPSIMTGHNNIGFDLYYLQNRVKITSKNQIIDGQTAKMKIKGLPLGRDGSGMTISQSVSQFRYDGSQQYDYHKTEIFGREIVDTFFLAMKYDVMRDFPSYALKSIVEHLGLEKEGRIKWDWENDDPSIIYERRNEPEFSKKWQNYKEYCMDDSDDSLKLFDKFIPAYFYINNNIPLTFQGVLLSATGSWINKFLIRGYIGKQHSIPTPNQREKVYGGISLGIPGVYRNVVKVDVKSMYPSIILQYKIAPQGKDPLGFFLKMVEFFTHKRFDQKDKFEKTGNERYNDLQGASKIFINSAFGTLSTSGLHFNDFEMADKITGLGRQIIRKTIKWATGNDVCKYYDGYDYEKDKKYDGIL